ncbi:MAG TPA: glycosyltransferase [Candidatus Acidoferrales bacterium]|nr:glycosyltransferase [Candidatus Acidoferrales bacterium]
MRIAHVIDSMDVGGAETVVAALCRLHAAAGHQVSVHCLFRGGAVAQRLETDGVPIFVDVPAAAGNLIRHLYREFRRVDPDVVHCHNKTATVLAAPVARMAGVHAVVSTRHGMAAPPYRLRKDFKYWLCAAVFCSSVVAVCETARRNMTRHARRLAGRPVTIRNGAYPARSSSDQVVKNADGFKLVTVGRLSAAKDYHVLLRSVAAALPRVPDLQLWIVGDGPEASSLKACVADLGIEQSVQFFGEQATVGDWLSRADVFVLSSVSEGLPISILEAMAAGLPAIVTDAGGMPEVLRLSGAGKVVPAGRVDLLARAIRDFASRRRNLKELGDRARSCYLQHFLPERMAAEYLSLYRSCLTRERAAI